MLPAIHTRRRHRQADRQTDRQTNRQADRQTKTDSETDRDRQTARETRANAAYQLMPPVVMASSVKKAELNDENSANTSPSSPSVS